MSIFRLVCVFAPLYVYVGKSACVDLMIKKNLMYQIHNFFTPNIVTIFLRIMDIMTMMIIKTSNFVLVPAEPVRHVPLFKSLENYII